jgi:hypothetical protein
MSSYVCVILLIRIIAFLVHADSKWPGMDDVVNVDKKDTFGENLSGLYYVSRGDIAQDTIYAIKNSPSTLYKLSWDARSSNWNPVIGTSASLSYELSLIFFLSDVQLLGGATANC